MRIAFTLVLLLHALIHVMGAAKAFGVAALPQLTVPISRPTGALWALAALLLAAAALALWTAPRAFWLVAAAGVAVSQAVIVASWADARWGTVLNVLVLAAAVYGAFAWGPFGLRAEYGRLVAGAQRGLGPTPAAMVTEADLAPLPAAVQRYLRFAGVVGRPRVRSFRATMSGRIRGAADAPWMPFVAEQHNFFDPPRRYFWMDARRAGLPVDGLHAYGESGASMRIRLLSTIPVVDLAGDALTRTETVTVLNDMAIMAPATLIDPAIRWREIEPRRVEATYTQGAHTVRAVLVFDAEGALADFESDDRPALGADGKTLQPQRWSTPIGSYRAQGPYWLASQGEARYDAPGGAYAYIVFDRLDVSTPGPGEGGPR